MKIVLDVVGEPKENDLIIFKDGKFKVVSRESFMSSYVKKHEDDKLELNQRIKTLESDLIKIAKLVKEK